MAVCERLGIELQEIPDWICCGSHPAQVRDELLAVALPARSLLNVEGASDVLTLCPSCFKSLKGATLKLERDSELRERVSRVLGAKEDFHCRRVRHLLEVLRAYTNDLKGQTRKPLKGLKVVSYYGCLLARPKEIIDFDDQEDPVLMDKLLELVGAEVLDWPGKTECCGMSFGLSKPEIERARGLELGLPILYFTQLLGLALGISPEELELNKHIVDPYPVLRGRGLV